MSSGKIDPHLNTYSGTWPKRKKRNVARNTRLDGKTVTVPAAPAPSTAAPAAPASSAD